MLRKNPALEIPADAPFKFDQLDRALPVKNLTRLIASITQPFVLSIEAPWGQGKTTFVRMWKAHLESESYPCVYFNAWETDFVDDPILPLVGEMLPLVQRELGEASPHPRVGEFWRAVSTLGGGALRKALPLAASLATHSLVTAGALQVGAELASHAAKEVADYAEDIAKERLKEYEAEKRNILSFRDNLAKLAKAISSSRRSSGPLVFFVDELDRCRPNYALALLERMRHLFAVDGIAFVLSLDRAQLENSLRAVYGPSLDVDAYLRRFFDLRFRLPNPDIEKYCTFLFRTFRLEEPFANRREGQAEAEALLTHLKEMARINELGLRDVDHCFTEVNLVLRTTGPRFFIYPELLAFLVVTKLRRPKHYDALHRGLDRPGIDEILAPYKDSSLDTWILGRVEMALVAAYLPEADRLSFVNGLRKSAEAASGPEHRRLRAMIGFLDGGLLIDNRLALPYLVSRIDLTRDFIKELDNSTQ